MKNKKQKGFTLAELMIAIFVFTIGILGAYVAIQQSSRILKHASNRLIAAYLAQEGVEIIKNIRDTNFLEKHLGYDSSNTWDEGFDMDSCYELDWNTVKYLDPNLLHCASRLLKIDPNGVYNYNSGKDTIFKREIHISSPDPDSKKIEVIVQWNEGNKSFEIKTIEKIYNWL